MSESGMRRRFTFCGFLMSLAVVGLAFRLFELHILTDATARETIEANRVMRTELGVERGRICDRTGLDGILAMDLAGKHVCADPSVIVSNNLVEAISASLSADLGMDIGDISGRLSRPDRRFARVKAFVHPEQAQRVAEHDYDGIFFRDTNIRYYPHEKFLCHVLGFVNHNGDGSLGVEQKMDQFLRGCPGVLESRKNAFRKELYTKRDRYIPSMEGADVVLTIDQFVQCKVEDVLDELMEEHSAKGAWAIVQRVRTGEILAMASRPGFNPNTFTTSDADNRLNRAIGYTYEPGSTLKAIIFAAALEEKLVTPDTRIDCENGAWLHEKRILRDYHPYGILSVADGLKKSSNILSAKMQVMLGDRMFYSYLKSFNLGDTMRFDLPGEERGILHPVSRWSGISGSRIAIGQGVAITALQLLGVYCGIANDGVMMRPYIVKEVVAKDGSTLYAGRPEALSRPITKETAATMRRMLGRIADEGGTGKRARVEGYTVAGKTGTAQKPMNGGYSDHHHVASFVGFLPAEAPELGIVVAVDDPQPIHTGGRVAAPGFQKIAEYAVRKLDVPASSRFEIAGR